MTSLGKNGNYRFLIKFFTSFIWGYLHTKVSSMLLPIVSSILLIWPEGRPEKVRKSPVIIGLMGYTINDMIDLN